VLRVFVPAADGLRQIEPAAGGSLPDDTLWVDLCEPTPAEKQRVEKALAITLPTREEMREIEASNRFREERGSLYLTVTLVSKLDTDLPENTQVTFILTGARLVTDRYADLVSFKRFIALTETHPAVSGSAPQLLAGLLETIVNRIADVMESVESDIESVSARVFTPLRRRRARQHDYHRELEQIGRSGELLSKARESLVSLSRLLSFLEQTAPERISEAARPGIHTVERDIAALSDHATFLGEKVQFILDATLGMVTIDQNNILKIFSVVAVLLLPPSVIGAFFGMNFQHIPLLHEAWGVWAALGMMTVSAAIPYIYFRRKGWL